MNRSRWHRVVSLLGLGLGLVGPSAFLGLPRPALAEVVDLHGLPARIELHSFPSLTLSDAQFLTGDAARKEVTLAGELRIAHGAGRLPVVVLLHGSGGLSGGIELWLREFLALGISTFTIDSFTGRGLNSVYMNQSLLGRLNFTLDAYRALELLARHPRVDPARIVLMGFSRGGQSSLYASLKRFHQTWNKSGADFAAYIPFYPDCATSYQTDTDVVDRPIRIFHGEADDYNPLAPCRAYVQRLKATKRNVELTTYPNAHHSFDSAYLPTTPMIARNAQTVRRCVLREEPRGHIISSETQKSFSYIDPCVQRDPHVGYDPAAAQAATRAVREFLTAVLHLGPKP